MKSYHCQNCETEFQAAQASACLKCGSVGIEEVSPPTEIVAPAASGEATGSNQPLPAVREVLSRLCRATYDTTFEGAGWDQLLEEALEELRPFLKAA